MNARNRLKLALYEGRSGGKCEVCRASPAIEMHEAIVTRGDVQGGSAELRKAIFAPENVLLVCRPCHVFARDKGFRILARLNGEQRVRDYVSELPWRHGVPVQLRKFGNEAIST